MGISELREKKILLFKQGKTSDSTLGRESPFFPDVNCALISDFVLESTVETQMWVLLRDC